MNVLGLLLFLVFGALLSSCQNSGFLAQSDHEKKTDRVYEAIYDYLTYGKRENP